MTKLRLKKLKLSKATELSRDGIPPSNFEILLPFYDIYYADDSFISSLRSSWRIQKFAFAKQTNEQKQNPSGFKSKASEGKSPQ